VEPVLYAAEQVGLPLFFWKAAAVARIAPTAIIPACSGDGGLGTFPLDILGCDCFHSAVAVLYSDTYVLTSWPVEKFLLFTI
jgi:hypothetical protein